MADISKLKIGSSEYSIKDTTARSGVSTNATAISSIQNDYISYGNCSDDMGVSSTANQMSFSLWDTKNRELLYTFPAATTTKAGVLTAADKVKIDKIDTITKDIAGGMHFIGTTSTALTDGATTATLVAASTNSLSKTTGFIAGDMVIYNKSEFVWNGSSWTLFGDLSSLGALAYKSSASGTLPSSSHTHNFIGTAHTHTATVSGGGVSGSCTPLGSVTLSDVYSSAGAYTKINVVSTNNSVAAAYLVSQRQLGTTTIKGVSGTTSITPFGSAGSLPTGNTVVTGVTGNSSTISVANEVLTIPASVLTGITPTTGNALSSRGTLPSAGSAVTVATANSSNTTVATYNAIDTTDSNWQTLSSCINASFTGKSTALSLTHTNPTVSIASTVASGTIASNTSYNPGATVTVK